MSFMKPQIVFGEWYEIDGAAGIEVIPADLVGHPPMVLGEWYENEEGTAIEEFVESLADYLSCFPKYVAQVRRVEGYGVRLSAPGYMDCTEWTVFATAKDAHAHLDEMYGEEDGQDTDH